MPTLVPKACFCSGLTLSLARERKRLSFVPLDCIHLSILVFVENMDVFWIPRLFAAAWRRRRGLRAEKRFALGAMRDGEGSVCFSS